MVPQTRASTTGSFSNIMFLVRGKRKHVLQVSMMFLILRGSIVAPKSYEEFYIKFLENKPIIEK
jgi:hypothetical protein